MNNLLRNFILSVLLIGITGCSHHIQIQKSFVVEDKLLPKLNITAPISIIATPVGPTEPVVFCKPSVGKLTVNYADLNDFALRSVLDILKRNKVVVMKGADKKLTVAIAGASCEQEFNGIKFNADLTASTGEILTKKFSGYQRSWSAHGNNFSVSAAVLNAVLEMFKDEEIRRYLEGQ